MAFYSCFNDLETTIITPQLDKGVQKMTDNHVFEDKYILLTHLFLGKLLRTDKSCIFATEKWQSGRLRRS